jgi:hypothetical protein
MLKTLEQASAVKGGESKALVQIEEVSILVSLEEGSQLGSEYFAWVKGGDCDARLVPVAVE